jgi:hypothetical protein
VATLPSLTKTWQFSVNNSTGLGLGTAIDINRTWIRTVKDALLAFASTPWTMRYSCNSVTAGAAGDGVDRITTNANLVWANAGSAHSWIVLRQTGVATNFELLLSCENSQASGTTLMIVVSPAAGFTGGTTTARPTATDELVINAAATAWSNTSANAQRWHLMQSTDGQCTRIITCSAGVLQSALIIEKPASPATGWTNPSMSYAGPNSVSCLSAAQLGIVTGAFGMRSGSTNGLLSMSAEGLITNTANVSFQTNTNWGNIANEISGEWPMLPLGAIGVTATIRGRHGTFQDVWTASGGANSGDTYPSGGSHQFAQFGALIVPWNGSAVQLS